MNTLIGLLLGIGIVFNFLATVALYRFPDVYSRLHGTTKCTTFGTIFTSLSVLLYGFLRYATTGERRFLTLGVHVIITILALLVTNATGAHAIARSAYRSGVRPVCAVVDRLREDGGNGGVLS